MKRRYAVIFGLHAIEYGAISVVYAAVPVVLRKNGAPLEVLGLFGALAFAFILSAFWAPVVDRYHLQAGGRRRSWIGLTQIVVSVLVLVLAFAQPSPENLPLLLALCLAISVVAATQRIAVLGYMAETLEPAERGFGATAAGLGGATGYLVGGTLVLVLIDWWGWQAALTAFAISIAVLGGFVLLIREPNTHAAHGTSDQRLTWSVLAQKHVWRLLLCLTPSSIGISAAYAMAEPRLVDVGFGLSQIGVIIGASNFLAFALFGPLISFGIRGVPPITVIKIVLGLTAVAFFASILITGINERSGAITSIIIIFVAFCAHSVTVNTIFMSLCRPQTAGTDLTTLMAISALLAMPGFIASGFLAKAVGHIGPIYLAAFGALISLLLLWNTKSQKSIQMAEEQVLP